MQNRSQKIVLEMILRIADRSRLLRVVKSFVKKVCRLQRLTRSFMARKRAWCEEAGVLWQQIEDRNLHSHHKLKEHERFLRELKTGGLRLKQERKPSTDESAAAETGTMEERMDRLLYPWKAHRIPRGKRMFTLARYYYFQAKHRRRQRDAMWETVALKTGVYKEMENYFKLCGMRKEEIKDLLKDEDSLSATPAEEPVRAERIGKQLLSEAEVIGLINLAAFELRARPPFQDHPANQFLEASDHVGQISQRFRKVIQLRAEIETQDPSTPHSSLSRTAPKSNMPAWATSKPEPVEVAPELEIKQEPALEFDAVMQRFSPRFLQETLTAKREAREARDAGQVAASEIESEKETLGVGGPRGPEAPDSEDDD